jgi:hypothetical protein
MSLIGLILTLVVVGVLLWLSTTTYRWIRRSRRSSTSWSSSGCRGLEVRGLDQRGRLLRAALGFAGCSMLSYDRALHALRTWLDSWAVIGHVSVGMARQGFDLQLTRYDERGEMTVD